MLSPTLVWFRRDLRLEDNPALAAAIERGEPVVPVFVFAEGEEEDGEWVPGGASRWWLHHALADLGAQLAERGSRLLLRTGQTSSLEQLRELARECGATAVYWNRRYEPSVVARDTQVKSALRAEGVEAKSFNAALLNEPQAVRNKSGGPFKVFTPFWRHCRGLDARVPGRVDLDAMAPLDQWPAGVRLEELGLLPSVGWDAGMYEAWEPTRKGALDRLSGFAPAAYGTQRDVPGEDGTTRLSPYLHFGQLGPREVLQRLGRKRVERDVLEEGIVRQLYWREFSTHLLFHFPETALQPLRPEFALFPWREDDALLGAWQRGETGYPIVDAGMRQLWATGWMHNRVRMIASSLLVKHLLQPWIEGARWFWDTLVDADLANNTMGWQWIAGCGADAAPYFRIFNPITQGERFDAAGNYVRRWVPELAKVPRAFIHRPWEAGELELSGAGVRLGKDYPTPVIAHSEGRRRALEAYARLKELRESAS